MVLQGWGFSAGSQFSMNRHPGAGGVFAVNLKRKKCDLKFGYSPPIQKAEGNKNIPAAGKLEGGGSVLQQGRDRALLIPSLLLRVTRGARNEQQFYGQGPPCRAPVPKGVKGIPRKQ